MTHNNSKRLTRTTKAIALAMGTLTVSAFIPGCGVGYVVRSAYFQAELLHSREPIQEIRSTEDLSSKQLAALDRIADVKAFGADFGLKATENYETIAWDWDREIWNLSACPPLQFKPVTWRFPIVGKVPYLGFFRRQDADIWASRLKEDGNDVYMRTAGAYSTLGWFRDPVLPPMLEWDDLRLADTVLHELVHATLWIPGSVKFNESFANFVGEKAAFQYLEARFGEQSPELRQALARHEDMKKWRDVLRVLYQDLDGVYKDKQRSDSQKMDERNQMYNSLEARVINADMAHPERFLKAVAKGPWNNARLAQYRTYNHRRDWFESILERNDGDLLVFMDAIEKITRDTKDPFKALKLTATRP
jgi:predicted aminopeptidase